VPNKKYFSYIRVSTQKQGQSGTSLAEQQAAIDRYSQSWGLKIIKCFEERETAAKQGRRVFLDMLKALRQGKADGLIVHKIDRSARNLKDWAAVGDLIDAGVEVHFANESLDLSSRGGRLSADIQAVVAADYIRNLRDEVRKGFYGRLKQGYYPMPAPIGYLDAGKAQAKTIDPVNGPLVQRAFELYSTGNHSLLSLSEAMFELGLRTEKGKSLSISSTSQMLHNPFYIGLIRIRKTGETFIGKHEPLVPKWLYDRVQDSLSDKNVKVDGRKHFYAFSRHITCAKCGNLWVAEKQKIYVYYRCHTRGCTSNSLNERHLHSGMLSALAPLQLKEAEYEFYKQAVQNEAENTTFADRDKQSHLQFQIQQIRDRLAKVADAYVDEIFDKQTYNEKTNMLRLEEKQLTEKLKYADGNKDTTVNRLFAFLELVNSAYLSYENGDVRQRRELVRIMTSNFFVDGESVTIKLEIPFQMLADRPLFLGGAPQRESTRTFLPLIKELTKYFADSDTLKDGDKYLDFLTPKKRNRFGRYSPTNH
jgi:site-specific DNA recombinase